MKYWWKWEFDFEIQRPDDGTKYCSADGIGLHAFVDFFSVNNRGKKFALQLPIVVIFWDSNLKINSFFSDCYKRGEVVVNNAVSS